MFRTFYLLLLVSAVCVAQSGRYVSDKDKRCDCTSMVQQLTDSNGLFRPRLFIQNGNMVFVAGAANNISFMTTRRGTILINEVDLRNIPPLVINHLHTLSNRSVN